MMRMEMIFADVEDNRTDFTDLHRLFVKNAYAMTRMAMAFFYVEDNRTDTTDLHGLFVKCSRDDTDGDDFLILW
ncbi:Uncharacterised protein [Chryseobacterium taklimakanense]|uniref:Uncharacterized protein n=1 Tax=Chryseobacterium taklimakanense TaxID=536441 RepID=A0A239X3A9_9FLAO|nr:Uncharacterised protein [Chryseobacterium taklimakanense]